MTKLQERDRTKLPKWAQMEINRLENDLEYAQERLGEGPADSNTFADPYADTPRPLGKNVNVEFRTGPDRHDRVLVSVEAGMVRVYGSDSLRVYPVSGNVVQVQPVRFSERWQ